MPPVSGRRQALSDSRPSRAPDAGAPAKSQSSTSASRSAPPSRTGAVGADGFVADTRVSTASTAAQVRKLHDAVRKGDAKQTLAVLRAAQSPEAMDALTSSYAQEH